MHTFNSFVVEKCDHVEIDCQITDTLLTLVQEVITDLLLQYDIFCLVSSKTNFFLSN